MRNGEEDDGYLYDFLYADTKRISSYLSQIDPSGVITAIKEVVSESDTITTEGALRLKIFNAALKGAGVNSQALERQFDATPTLPWSLLHVLDEKGYLGTDLETTPVGRMVLVKGTLGLIDLKLLRDAWRPINEQWIVETKSRLEGVLEDPSTTTDQKKEAKANLARLEKQIPIERAGIDVIEKLPHTINLTFHAAGLKCWSVISSVNFLFDPEDIMMKHGPIMEGTWYMAAIVDARPEPDSGPPPPWQGGTMQELMVHMARQLKHRFGRPPGYFAVTPIAIYRAVERP